MVINNEVNTINIDFYGYENMLPYNMESNIIIKMYNFRRKT